jgi:UDP-N-acetylglucosamine/UDP-N-acetylgalactosamine 4-epimerase
MKSSATESKVYPENAMSANKSGKKIMVTGGAGFIGSHIVEDLLDLGYEITVFDNFETGKRENLEQLGAGKWRPNQDFKVVEGDIRDLGLLEEATKGLDGILHQAALGSVPRSIDDPLTTQQVNADGTLNVFLAAKKNKVSRVVYASSSAIYGESPVLPRLEGQEGAVLSPYALTKKINEEYAKLCYDLYGLETVGLRYFNVFGPRQDPTSQYAAVIPLFVTALLTGKQPTIYGTGQQSRDFTYVKDVVAANIKALEAPAEAAGKAFNIGRGDQATLLELLAILQELLGTNIEPIFDPPRAGDVMHSNADTTRARTILGFEAQYDIREGLKKGIEWYKNNLK